MARLPKNKKTNTRSFHQELVLNRWMLGFFKGDSLSALKLRLGDDRHEGIDEDGKTKFFHALTRNLFEVDPVSEADLRRYDLNSVDHWQASTVQRNKREGDQCLPVWPNPPSPRTDESKSVTRSSWACSTGTRTSWAMRSPISIRKGCEPRFQQETRSCPW